MSELDSDEYHTLRVLTRRAISHLRAGKPVAAFEDLQEIQAVLEFDDES